MFSTLLIANRGEIACRVIRTARRMGIKTVAVYSDADAGAPHVAMADQAVRIGPPPASESYLNVAAILEAARVTWAKVVHPGYGFLSENAAFAEACAKAGLAFVGPPPAAIRAMGLKDAAKALMIKAGVPVVPGYHGDAQSAALLAKEAERIGYPVLIKAVAGGGGKGMRRVDRAADFAKALEGAQREAQSAFGEARVLVEKYVSAPRHIEIQVFADTHGNAVHLFERDCSLQRRHQKVIEEAPAPGMPADVRRAMGEAAVKCAKAIGYQGAGTVEFIVDGSKGLKADGFYFMEMNTRLQVEHPVTEMITGLDLVEWQLRVADGEKLPRAQDQLAINGHAVEVRLYAEDPVKGFLPSTGTLARLKLPQADAHVRVDSGVAEGGEVSMFYDPMIAKVISWDQNRTAALARLASALETAEVAGVKTNLAFLISALRHDAFVAGEIDTGFIDRHKERLIGAAAPAPADAVLFAALFVLLERRAKAAGPSPWRHLDGWRIGGVRQEEMLRLTEGETDRVVGVLYRDKGWRLSLDGHALDADAVFDRDGSISASLNGRRAQARVLRVSGNLVVLMQGRTYSFEPHDPLEAAEHTHDTGKELRAPMPGKVVQIMTKPGDRVRKGQALAIIEAMKMEHTLSAPGDLTVKDVPFHAGDQVGEGVVVVSFE
ncbi:MAG: acetyl/propionyl/methylcrotonyl-CoA carboxylase subunit alpha [Alphaproteobacteria bacterium]|nr:acetyl/propionyl/methylcrotonyl-CoA carboxylase subunit alpha [Alphaproteobacteria bacterium]